MDPTENYHKKYYESHKQKYKEVYNARKRCDVCDAEYSKLNFSKHLKSKTHALKANANATLQISPDQMQKLMEMLQQRA